MTEYSTGDKVRVTASPEALIGIGICLGVEEELAGSTVTIVEDHGDGFLSVLAEDGWEWFLKNEFVEKVLH